MTDAYEREAARLRGVAARRESGDLPLFVTPIREMARRGSPDTSKRAAITIADRLTHLQADVLDAYRRHGPMSARKAENLPEFKDRCAASTIRKRISELAGRSRLHDTGEEDRGCAIYDLSPAQATPQEAA